MFLQNKGKDRIPAARVVARAVSLACRFSDYKYLNRDWRQVIEEFLLEEAVPMFAVHGLPSEVENLMRSGVGWNLYVLDRLIGQSDDSGIKVAWHQKLRQK